MFNPSSSQRILLTGVVLLFVSQPLIGWSEPVFKSVDAEGRTSYAYTPTANAVSIKIIQLTGNPSPPDAIEESKDQLDRMREVTDRMAADRKAREEERQEQAKAKRSQGTYYEYESEPIVEYYYLYYPRYRRTGFYSGHKNFHKRSHRKFHQTSPTRSSFRSHHFHHRISAIGSKRSMGHLKARTHRRSGVRAEWH